MIEGIESVADSLVFELQFSNDIKFARSRRADLPKKPLRSGSNRGDGFLALTGI